jgi:hypothetical protein
MPLFAANRLIFGIAQGIVTAAILLAVSSAQAQTPVSGVQLSPKVTVLEPSHGARYPAKVNMVALPSGQTGVWIGIEKNLQLEVKLYLTGVLYIYYVRANGSLGISNFSSSFTESYEIPELAEGTPPGPPVWIMAHTDAFLRWHQTSTKSLKKPAGLGISLWTAGGKVVMNVQSAVDGSSTARSSAGWGAGNSFVVDPPTGSLNINPFPDPYSAAIPANQL